MIKLTYSYLVTRALNETVEDAGLFSRFVWPGGLKYADIEAARCKKMGEEFGKLEWKHAKHRRKPGEDEMCIAVDECG